ncbi:MAG: ABC-type transport auxiliary lipoprotein family protein [Candidatus Aminicenantes bacterium]
MKTKWIIFGISGILVLAGCFSSPGRHYFELSLSAETAPHDARSERILMINDVLIDDTYDDYRIVYRVSSYEINYYSYVFWADKPDILIENSVAAFFKEKGLFRDVIQEFDQLAPDWILKTRIHVIEEVDEDSPWSARLAMEMRVLDSESQDILVSHRFDRREKLESNNVVLVPIVISRILEEELEILTKRMVEVLNAR